MESLLTHFRTGKEQMLPQKTRQSIMTSRRQLLVLYSLTPDEEKIDLVEQPTMHNFV